MASGAPWKRCVLVVELGRRWRKGPRTLGQELSRPRRANVIQGERTSQTRQRVREQAEFFAVCQRERKKEKGKTEQMHTGRLADVDTARVAAILFSYVGDDAAGGWCRRRACREGR